MRKYQVIAGEPGCVFFDRGVFDAVGMLHQAEPLPPGRLDAILAAHRYEPVFLFPAWDANYSNDRGRDQSFAQALEVEAGMRRAGAVAACADRRGRPGAVRSRF